MKLKKVKLRTSLVIVMGYFLVIFLGAFLLSLPFSSKEGNWTHLIDCLFTSSSAATGSGLSLFDTDNYWSLAGQIIILLLIQFGGIGFMTLYSSLGLFIKRKINLTERKMIMQDQGNFQLSGIVALVKKVLIITFTCEGIGAICLMFRFIPDYGIGDGIFTSIFLSISAFCTAGIDIIRGTFVSLTGYSGDVLVNVVLDVLMIIGGLGFLVIDDLFACRFKWKKFHLHTKIVLITTLVLGLFGTVLVIIFEQSNLFLNVGIGEQILKSSFTVFNAHATGFNSIEVTSLTKASIMVITILMFIGGSPGSTASGIKTTTFVVLIYAMINGATRNSQIRIGKRRLESSIVKQALAIFCLYVMMLFTATLIILVSQEELDIHQVVFELISAISNIGISLGVSGKLNMVNKLLFAFIMYFGRIGALTTIGVFKDADKDGALEYPEESIIVG